MGTEQSTVVDEGHAVTTREGFISPTVDFMIVLALTMLLATATVAFLIP